MCFYGLVGCIGERIRQAIACLCFIACAGPIMIIVGCISLAAHNTRDSRISSWTSAIATFDASVLPNLRGTNAALSGVSMSLLTSTVAVQGNQENVPQSVTSTAFSTRAAPATSWSFATSINGTDASNVTLSGTGLTTSVKTNVYCTYAYCTSGCSGSSSNYYCRNINSYACGDGSFSGLTSCYGDDGLCGTCTRNQYLSSVCVPMALTGAGAATTWQLSSSKRSCTYPFGSQQQYSTNYASSIPVKLMSDQDPYVTLSQITSGDNDFGITTATQHKAGSSLLVVGIIISVVVYGIIAAVVYRFCCRNAQGDVGYVSMPEQQTIYGQPAYGQPGYGQPAYGQPGMVAPYPAPIQQQVTYVVPQQSYPQQPTYGF